MACILSFAHSLFSSCLGVPAPKRFLTFDTTYVILNSPNFASNCKSWDPTFFFFSFFFFLNISSSSSLLESCIPRSSSIFPNLRCTFSLSKFSLQTLLSSSFSLVLLGVENIKVTTLISSSLITLSGIEVLILIILKIWSSTFC